LLIWLKNVRAPCNKHNLLVLWNISELSRFLTIASNRK